MPRKKTNEVEVLKAQLARALADYDNLRKRVERERIDWEKSAGLGIIKELLPVLDILYQVELHLKDQGLEFAIKEFENVLTREGIERIKAGKGDEFNPHYHEVAEVIEGGEAGKIAEEVLSGWRQKDSNFVLRVSKVKVYK